MAGVSLSHWPVSHTSARSAVTSLPCSARNAGSDGEPHSSSPSSSTVMAIGQAPATLFQARAASKKVMSWPLLSSAPRATITLPLTLSEAMRGSNGGDFHSSSGSTRLHVVVAVEQHVRRRSAGGRPWRGPPPSDGRSSSPAGPRSRCPAAGGRTIPPPAGTAACRRGRWRRWGCGSARTAAPAPRPWVASSFFRTCGSWALICCLLSDRCWREGAAQDSGQVWRLCQPRARKAGTRGTLLTG